MVKRTINNVNTVLFPLITSLVKVGTKEIIRVPTNQNHEIPPIQKMIFLYPEIKEIFLHIAVRGFLCITVSGAQLFWCGIIKANKAPVIDVTAKIA